MKLNLKETDSFHLVSDQSVPSISVDESSKNAMGGTEMMKFGLYERLSPEIRDEFQIICSRVREVDPTRPSLLWLHDTWDDPEVQHLTNEKSRERFEQLIFVSYYQFWSYHHRLGIPYTNSLVFRNAIEPIPAHKKKLEGPVRLIYHTTPHRGLEILVPAFEKITEAFPNLDVHLDVFSSFSVYGWEKRDIQYKHVFDRIEDHPQMTYHGGVDNATVREALKEAHIFAYPSIWPETSCIAAIEAMSAGCLVVCPNYGALPETTNNFSVLYPWAEDIGHHANIFAQTLKRAIDNVFLPENQEMFKYQIGYTNTFYSWDSRIPQWEGLLRGILETKKS